MRQGKNTELDLVSGSVPLTNVSVSLSGRPENMRIQIPNTENNSLKCFVFQVLGKCYVMCVKDYFKFRPEGFEEKDIFVCEWRYTSKIRNWKKIKPSSYWDTPDHVTIVPRDVPLLPNKIPSVFKVRFL